MPGKGFNKAGDIGRVAQSPAQALNRRVQVVFEIDKSLRRPKSLTQFLSRHDLARVFQQCCKNLDWLPL